MERPEEGAKRLMREATTRRISDEGGTTEEGYEEWEEQQSFAPLREAKLSSQNPEQSARNEHFDRSFSFRGLEQPELFTINQSELRSDQ